ncbi:hypothetical protein MAR_015020 [Mya arenaria]|uniref:Uncharacterized protein n=1 Tax=Mya arenaria TaxID=6604 RepID=A0ABY7FJE1_MYAAR|nr:hypothetical protein MAR_015020 [Mya arenaria]
MFPLPYQTCFSSSNQHVVHIHSMLSPHFQSMFSLPIPSMCSPPTHSMCSPPTHSMCSPPTHSMCSPPTHSMCSPPTHSMCSPPTHSMCSPPTHSMCSLPIHSMCSPPIHSMCSPPIYSMFSPPTHRMAFMCPNDLATLPRYDPLSMELLDILTGSELGRRELVFMNGDIESSEGVIMGKSGAWEGSGPGEEGPLNPVESCWIIENYERRAVDDAAHDKRLAWLDLPSKWRTDLPVAVDSNRQNASPDTVNTLKKDFILHTMGNGYLYQNCCVRISPGIVVSVLIKSRKAKHSTKYRKLQSW